MPGARRRGVQGGARHVLARVCPAVHNTLAQKTCEGTTQFVRSVWLSGNEQVLWARLSMLRRRSPL
jgi:hypothetical protein